MKSDVASSGVKRSANGKHSSNDKNKSAKKAAAWCISRHQAGKWRQGEMAANIGRQHGEQIW